MSQPPPPLSADQIEELELLTCSECAEELGLTRQSCGGLCEGCFARAWDEHQAQLATEADATGC